MNKSGLTLTLGYKCNFNCKYCHERSLNEVNDSMTDEVLDRSIELIQFLSKDVPVFEVGLYGGEPLVYRGYIEKIFNTFQNNPNIHYIIYTNGSLIKEYEDWIIQLKDRISVQISYDFEPLQSKNRKCYAPPP